ncbi:MAG: pitrilysin family protein [Candidatus Eisenbacteria bacterium]
MKRSILVFSAMLSAAMLFAPLAQGASNGPGLTRTRLDNGLTVIVMPSQRLPLVDLRLVARAGAVQDPAGKGGVAQLTALLLTQGAGKRSAQQLAEAIEFVGGSLEANAGQEQFTVSAEVLRKDFGLGLELFRDCIVTPNFSAEEFARKREETLGAIASDKSEPSVIAEEKMASFLWGESPLARPARGTEASVTAIQRDDVAAFHKRFVAPDRAILVIVGDVDAKMAIAAATRAFASWKPSGEPLTDPYGPAPTVKGRQVRIIDKPEATQAQIRMACPGVARSSPDYYALEVANTILGAGFTSRLVNSIRVEKGLTYSISSRFGMLRGAGSFRINTFTRNEKLRPCVDAVLAEVQKLVDEGPTTAELDKSRNYLTGQYPLGLQAPDDLAGEIANMDFFGLEPQFIQTYNARVRAVTMTDVKRVLKQYFCVRDLKILVVTNGELARKSLAGVGAIEVKPID